MDIQKMPKVELHLHLDGSVRYQTALEIMGNIKEEDMIVSDDCHDLNEYLTKFSVPLAILQTKENLERVAYELALDLKSENVIYAEIRFAPLKHLLKGLSPEEVIESVLKGLKKVNIKTNLILCMMRGDTFDNNLKVIALALKFLNRGVCALDLAGAESLYPTSDYKELFAIAQANGIPFTIHAGEAAGFESIKEALDFGALRIGHGIKCLEDEKLIKELKEKNILLEICPTSNIQTKAVTAYQKHPVYELYKKGVPICINTDNRTVSNITLTKEYQKLMQNFSLTTNDLKQMNINAINGAFLTNEEKEKLKKLINK